MNKIYPTEVKKLSEEIISILKDSGFFENEDFSSTDYAEKHLNEVFLKQYLNEKPLGFATVEELDEHLNIIVVGSILYELKGRGIVDTYEDEDTEEVFFLTGKGREIKKRLQ